MFRRGCTILVLAALVGSTSGLALALHLHAESHAAGGHKPDSCAVCVHLIRGSTAITAASPLLPAHDDTIQPVCAAPAEAPPSVEQRTPLFPRAPPLV